MKKILTTLLLGILLLNLTSALDCWGIFKQDTNIELIQKCPSCSYVNITSITYPNGTIFLNEEMQNTGINFNYTLPDSSQEGIISYGTIGDKNGASPPNYEDLCIQITKTGNFVDTGESMMYIWILIFIAIFLVGAIIVSVITPSGNIIEQTKKGPAVVKVSKLKYLKIMAIWFSYALFLLFVTVLTGMTNNYIQFEPMKTMFTNIYFFLSALGKGINFSMVAIIFVLIWKDIILNKIILKEGKALLKLK